MSFRLKSTKARTLFSLIILFPHLQLPHRAFHHLFKLVSRHAQRLVDVAQRPFHNGLVGRFADDQSHGGVVALATQQLINGGNVEIQLAGKLGDVLHHLQFNDDIAVLRDVIEQQIGEEGLSARHLQLHLSPHIRKALAQLHQEARDIRHKRIFQVLLLVLLAHREEPEMIGIL